MSLQVCKKRLKLALYRPAQTMPKSIKQICQETNSRRIKIKTAADNSLVENMEKCHLYSTNQLHRQKELPTIRKKIPNKVTISQLVFIILIANQLFYSTHVFIQATSLNRTNIGELVRQTPTSINNNNDFHINQHLQASPLSLPPIPSSYVKLSNNSSNPRTFNSLHRSNQSYMLSDSDLNLTQKRVLFEKICIGTSHRFSSQRNKTDQYQNLVERYRNCTYVIGNLEITWLERGHDNKSLDLSFLESIREITGYLLIAYVKVEKIRLPNLQIIRGRDLFKLKDGHDYAIFVIENHDLESLELPNLREIIAGDVGFWNNRNLCYIQTINWEEIQNANHKPKYSIDTKQYGTPRKCPSCHETCPDSCWGPGPEMCQKFSKTNCSPQCEKGRCFGSAPRECCHLFCAGGCTGPKQTDCLACKNFNNDGECIQECPPMMKYNPSKFIWEADPSGKYAYGATCVKECPEHLLRDNGACVRSCPPDKRSRNGECIPCTGPCPKECQGVDIVNSKNIDRFINCTEIEGSITILDTSFSGYSEIVRENNTMGARYGPMHPSRLKVFETIHTITGYLNIQAAHPDFKDLSFFSKLELIKGSQTTDMFHSLSIIKTSLRSLNLRSLKKVMSGKVVIEENKDLCFADPAQFAQINITQSEITIRNNCDDKRCKAQGLKCHEQCGLGGCWGLGPEECLSCISYKLDDYCVNNCTSTKSIGILSYNSDNMTCSKCHSECEGGCTGSSGHNCFQCKNFKDGPYCVSECPKQKYSEQGICQECHKSCTEGCTGPSNRYGEDGCNACGKTVVESSSPNLVAHCIKTEEQCPEGYYQEYVGLTTNSHPLKPLEGKPVCRRCHPKCKSCTGYGTHKEVCECAGYAANDQCEDSCPRDYYADEKSRRCIKCSRECNGCFGPTEADCLYCRVYRIYLDNGPVASARVIDKAVSENIKQQGRFNCTSSCPPEKPHRISDSNLLDPYCSEDPGPDSDNPRIVSMGSTSFIFILIVSAAIMFCVSIYKCQIEKDKTVKRLTMRLSGFDDLEPLNQSHLKPNLAPLRSIKETELRKGKELGKGFGGIVYQGVWIPEGCTHKDQRPVAIKVLHDNGQSNMKEFLDEAYIMASVNHPNLIKLLAICMTPNQFMLVTQLMPLGCLLDYVEKHKQEIGSKNLLEWGKQIAKGMAYLEGHRMVHRDLALRNVLLQTSKRALISDFGLAKFLEVDQSEYHSGGGRLPIKWLAPECIRERKFTHKSDVWAFGVTIWELLTFGQRPFEEYDTKDVPMAIEKGARLEHPRGVSAEVYKVMYSCWFYSPEKRPNFKSLEHDFVNFARDPERYLVCGANGICRMLSRNSESDENECQEYNSDSNSVEEEESPTISNGIDHNMFRFGLRHHNSESETLNGQLSTPTSKKAMFPNGHGQHHLVEEVFSKTNQRISPKSSNMTITDSNNNSNNNNNFFGASNSNQLAADSCWTVHNTISTNSLGQRSEQPTDLDDYLLPSPCSNEDKFTKFLASHEGQNSKHLPPPPPPHSRDPPHSAGLIGISNQEYFLTRAHMNYVNSNGLHGGSANVSSSHIPHSLV